MKAIFFTINPDIGIKTGREMLSSLVWTAMQQINSENTSLYQIEKKKKEAVSALISGVTGWLDGLTKENTKEFISTIRRSGATHIVIDGSNFGRLAQEIKIALPQVKVITLFHNVEYLFFRSNFKRLLTPRSFAVMGCNYVAERMAVKWSDVVLCLNVRDAEKLRTVYGNITRAKRIEIFPLCISENSSSNRVFLDPPSKPRFALFVGGAFYANVEGVRWFARNVAGHINCKTYIVGKGFGVYRDELESFKNIKVVGEVEDLGAWYKNASFVVSPIFDGSGMKTKTAEAIQFGRPIFGTDEAFVGFESFIPKVGFLCNDLTTFINSINKFLLEDCELSPLSIRNIYLNYFSSTAAQKRLLEVFKN